jgi:hypothetical protein
MHIRREMRDDHDPIQSNRIMMSVASLGEP